VADSVYRRMLNNWIHDFASGTWAACVLVIWVLSGRTAGLPSTGAAASAIADSMQLLFWLSIGALVVIFATGGIRLRYWRTQVPADEIPHWGRGLLAKHAAYFVVYGAGTLWAWYLLRVAAVPR
jgi:hypothetical protein